MEGGPHRYGCQARDLDGLLGEYAVFPPLKN